MSHIGMSEIGASPIGLMEARAPASTELIVPVPVLPCGRGLRDAIHPP